MISFAQSENNKVNLFISDCSKGEKGAIKDAANKKFKLITYGLVVSKDWEFDKFYSNFIKTKYGIEIGNGGCVVFESELCYYNKMKELIYQEFGENIFEKAKKEARVLYSKND